MEDRDAGMTYVESPVIMRRGSRPDGTPPPILAALARTSSRDIDDQSDDSDGLERFVHTSLFHILLKKKKKKKRNN